MKEHLNFYENLREAHMRLNKTIVLYDGVPYYIIAITSHKKDGIFRAYLWPLGLNRPGDAVTKRVPFPDNTDHYGPEHEGLGPYLDKFIEDNKETPLLRKMLNSPSFNKFRPFPLGMVNMGTGAYFTERTPVRRTEQGLTRNMVKATQCVLEVDKRFRSEIDTLSKPFEDCILGKYPSAQECLTNLLDPAIDNTAAAFHRQFALVRGPMNLIFVCYKADVVGMLPYKNMGTLLLDKKFLHTKESIEELGLFGTVTE